MRVRELKEIPLTAGQVGLERQLGQLAVDRPPEQEG